MTSDVVFGIRVWGKGGSCRERIGMDEEVWQQRKENRKQGIKREKKVKSERQNQGVDGGGQESQGA